MSGPLYALIVLCALLLADRLVTAPTVRRSVGLGAVIGLGILTRTEALLLLPLLAWPAAFRPSRARAVRLFALTAAGAFIVAPWVARNVVVFHRFMLAGSLRARCTSCWTRALLTPSATAISLKL